MAALLSRLARYNKGAAAGLAGAAATLLAYTTDLSAEDISHISMGLGVLLVVVFPANKE